MRRSKGGGQSPVVFLAGNSDTQLKSFLPVIALLRKRTELPVAVLLLDSVYGNREGHGRAATLEDLRADGVTVREVVETERPLPARGVFGKAELIVRYRRELRRAFDVLRPALLLVGNDITYVGQYAIRLARSRKAYVIVLEDGVRSSIWSRFQRERILQNALGLGNAIFNGRIGLSRLACNKMAVWGPVERDFYLCRGLPRDVVTITGQPRFDVIRNRDWREESNRVYLGLGVGPDELRILFAPNWISKQLNAERQIFATTQLLRAVARLREMTGKSCRLIVKLPRVANNIAAFYPQVPHELLHGVVSVQDVELYPLLHGCDLVITFFSTVGVEAMLFDKPLITPNFTGKPFPVDFSEEGAALGVHDPSDLAPAIERVLRDPGTQEMLAHGRRSYLERHVANPGCAAAAVCDLACSLLDSRSRRSLSAVMA